MVQSRGIGSFRLAGGAIALGLLISLTGCASRSNESASRADDYPAAKSATPESSSSDAPLHTAAREPGAVRSTIRQATLGVEVDNLDKAEKAMKESIALHRGYIAHEAGSDLASEHPSLQLMIRIPESTFEDVLTGFESLGHRIEKTITASDITEQILDNEARLRQLQTDQTVLTDKSRTPALNSGFDSMKDRIKELQNRKAELMGQAAMATIELNLNQKPNAVLSSAANSTWGSDTWNSAVSSAMGAFRVIGALGIWLLVYSPIWASVAFVSFWVYRLRKRAARSPQVA